MPFHCAPGPFSANEEPTLAELLAEPVVRLMMARDGYSENDVRAIAAAVRMKARREAQEARDRRALFP
jgi:hypothetical protein